MKKKTPQSGSYTANISQKRKQGGKGKPFTANNPETGERDDRINRAGRPRDADDLRADIQRMFNHEDEIKGENGQTISRRTRIETLILLWYLSGEFNKQFALLQYGYGKVPDQLQIQSHEEELVKRYISKFTDGELDRITKGESAFDILVGKLDSLFDSKLPK